MRNFDGVIKVYDKNKKLLAIFDSETEGLSEEAKRDLMVRPLIHLETNGSSTLSFQMLANSQKWQDIKDPENLYYVNGRWYTALSDNAYQYEGEDNVRVVNVTLSETWYLLDRKYNQAYNCGVYCYAKAKFNRWVNDGASFTINSADCSNPGNTISKANAWSQVKKWTAKDEKGNALAYAILTSDEYKPTKWENAPSGVHLRSFTVSGSTATLVIESLGKTTAKQTFEYQSGGSYYLKNQEGKNLKPIPSKIDKVTINYTTTTQSGNKVTYRTDTKEVGFTYSSSGGYFRLNYTKPSNVTVNGVIAEFTYNNLGDISTGATCTFAYGAEAIDQHTFVILPKANTKYKLTVNGVEYADSQVKDSRGAVMPRGSGGYAMWAALKDSGWTLGVCDVIASGFNAKDDYGCFNVESDMKDVLYNVQYIQQLYGGILDWDSENQVVNYRAENYTDYQAYRDGFNDWVGVEFREGKNMLEQPVITYDNKIITKAFILGYGNLNIGQVNNGKNYITNFSYTNDVYEGYLTQTLIFDTNDEGGQKQLLYWGQKELAKQCRPRKTISLSVQDMRAFEDSALSHEVFDINNIVKVYYRDDQDNTETMDEQRVIVWEYNAFAMWDCHVELGDKTKNLVDLFHLIYKSTLSPNGSNASGEIPSNKVTIGDGNKNDYSGLDKYGSNFEQYIQLIARTTTENSDAIAGLILDTSATHAQVDLFAQYQKQTDNMFTQTYAGLQFYADEKSAQAIVSANNYTEQQITELDGSVTKRIAQTEASLKTYADSKYSALSATVSGNYTYLNDKIGKLEIKSAAGLEALQNEQEALVRQFASYKIDVNGQIREVESRIESYASEFVTYNTMVSEINNSMAGIYTQVEDTVNGELAKAGLVTYKNGQYVAGVQIIGNGIHIGGTWGTSTYFNTETFYLKNREVYLCNTTVQLSNGDTATIHYVGHY